MQVASNANIFQGETIGDTPAIAAGWGRTGGLGTWLYNNGQIFHYYNLKELGQLDLIKNSKGIFQTYLILFNSMLTQTVH